MHDRFDLAKYLNSLTKALEKGKHRETYYYARHREGFMGTFVEAPEERFLRKLCELRSMHELFDIDENLSDPDSDRKSLARVQSLFRNIRKVESIAPDNIAQLVKTGTTSDNSEIKGFRDLDEVKDEFGAIVDELKSNGHLYISCLGKNEVLSQYAEDILDVVCEYSFCTHTDLLIMGSIEMFETFRTICFPPGTTDRSQYSKVFSDWLFALDIDTKREEAAKVFSSLISNLRSKAILADTIERWSEDLSKFEELIIFVKKRIEADGFYRDHLNHVIRVALMMMFLMHRISKAKPKDVNLSRQDMEAGVISALFHDICYPVEQSVDLFRNTSDALSECYSVFRVSEILWDYERVLSYKDTLKEIEESLSSIIEENIAAASEDWRKSISHAILSSSQYLDLQRETRKTENPITVSALCSILLHDSKLADCDSEISFAEKPIPCLLIICDELQEWGRPVVDLREVPIPEIDIDVENGDGKLTITATFDHSDFSRERNGLNNRLRPISSKFHSLGRIIFDANVNIVLRFELSKEPDFYKKLERKIELKYLANGTEQQVLLNDSDSVFFSEVSEEVVVFQNANELEEIGTVTIQSCPQSIAKNHHVLVSVQSKGKEIHFANVTPITPEGGSVEIFTQSRAVSYKCSHLLVFGDRKDLAKAFEVEVKR